MCKGFEQPSMPSRKKRPLLSERAPLQQQRWSTHYESQAAKGWRIWNAVEREKKDAGGPTPLACYVLLQYPVVRKRSRKERRLFPEVHPATSCSNRPLSFIPVSTRSSY